MNLFLAQSPSHIAHSEILISSVLNEEENLLVNLYNYSYKKSLWSDVIVLNNNLKNTQDSLWNRLVYQYKKIRLYKNYIAVLEKKIQKKNPDKIFFCHIEDAINNYIFFKYRKNKNTRFYLVEDGSLNYYEYKVNVQVLVKLILKSFFYTLLGLKYHPYLGYVSGIDKKKIVCQYVKKPNLSVFQDKSRKLNAPEIKYRPEEEVILIVGQESEINYYGLQEYLKALTKMMNIIKNDFKEDLNKKKIFYKPHRYGNIGEDKLKPFFDGINYKILQPDLQVEALISEIKPKFIYSFWSSALMNFVFTFNNELLSEISITSIRYFKNPLEKLYKRLGIRTI